MDTGKQKDLLARIKALIANAEDYKAQGNLATSELYSLKAQELLIKYKLDLTDIERLEEEENNPFSYELVEPSLWGDKEYSTRVETTEDIAATLAEACFCRILVLLENNKLIIVGRKSDIEITKFLISRVIRQAFAFCEIELLKTLDQFMDEGGDLSLWINSGGNSKFRLSFLNGFNYKIANRLKKQQEEFKGESSALILRDANKQVEDYLKSLHPNLLDEPSDKQYSADEAFSLGMDYGETISLSIETEKEIKQIGV